MTFDSAVFLSTANNAVLKYFCLIQDSDDEDDVIIESEEEQSDSGYDAHISLTMAINSQRGGLPYKSDRGARRKF